MMIDCIENEMNNSSSIKKSNQQEQQQQKIILINDETKKDIDSLIDQNVAAITTTTATSVAATNHVMRRDSTTRKSLWSKIALKFRFVQHFMKKSRENKLIQSSQSQRYAAATPPSTSKELQFNLSLSTNASSSTSRSDLKSTGSMKYVDTHNRQHISYLERTLSSRSYCNELRSRIKSDSDKDSCSCTDDVSNDYTASLFEINSNSQLNTPNSIKCANKFNDYLFLVNSDNETVDLFNKNDKSLTTFIDPTLSNATQQQQHSVRTPVDIASTNSNLFISDWLNDEILVYNYDGQLQTTLANNQIKHFSAPWGVAVDAVNDYLYVCNTSKNTVEIFDSRLQYYQTLGKASLTSSPINKKVQSTPSGGSNHMEFHTPKWLINCDNWGFALSDWDVNEIKLIDRHNNQLIRTIRDCYNPEGLTLLERTGTQLLVLSSHQKNILKMFDILSGRLIKTYDLFSLSSDNMQNNKYEANNSNSLCSIYGLRGLCYSNEKIYFTDSIKNKIFICNL